MAIEPLTEPIVVPEQVPEPGAEPARSRRSVLGTGLAGLAGLVLGSLGLPRPAEAAAGGSLVMGSANSAGTSNTSLTTASAGTALLVTQTGAGTALRGSATAVNGIAGFFTSANGPGVSGVTANNTKYGVYGGNDAAATGAGAAMRANGEQNHGLVATTASTSAYAIKATNTNPGTGSSAGVGIRVLAGGGTDADIDGLEVWPAAGEFCGANGVIGAASSETTNGDGVIGVTAGGSGRGVSGRASSGTGTTYGVEGDAYSSAGTGVYGRASSGTGTTYGVEGDAYSSAGTGVYGQASSVTGETYGVYGRADSTEGTGVYGHATSGTGVTYGVWGQSDSTGGFGVYGSSDSDAGVYGSSGSGTGVYGASNTAIGVWGYSTSNYAIYSDGHAVVNGNLDVIGTLTKGGGSFKIDHPLDPANKFLYHSFVESPDMKNVYDGVVTLDAKGEATVTLPDWFEALNRDTRIQLTAVGQFSPLYVKTKVQNGAFSIAGGKAGQEVYWQLTGIRKDAWADAHRIPVEEEKPADERGLYLHPIENGQPAAKGIDAVRNAAMKPHAGK
jgi:hypothetical protein